VKGRGVIAAVITVCALMAVVAGTAAPAKADRGGGLNGLLHSNRPTWIDPTLVARSKTTPGNLVDVIITSTGGSSGATGAVSATGFLAAAEQKLAAIGGIELKLPARFIPFLQRIPGLVITPNATVRLSGDGLLGGVVGGVTSTLNGAVGTNQLWPQVTGNDSLWSGDLANTAAHPAIAVIDSGVTPGGQFGNRVIANVNLSTLAGNTSLADENGHGDFVAGIAAGSSPTLTGADPAAPLVSIKVMDANGTAKTSDVIAACQWILDHKDQYNIRVANFSMHSSYGTNSYYDPLDKAVEKLWFSGVTVVAAAGNYGDSTKGASGVLYSPGNDPFVITVGALDTNNTVQSGDDGVAPWSAYGYTEDGFSKPEIVAPGRYMVQTVPLLSTLLTEFPTKILNALTGQMQISGTSFAAPVVSGTVAEMLARHPGLTPDQVKGQLMQTARPVPNAPQGAAGVGEVSSYYAAHDTATPNPNAALDQFVGADPNGGSVPVFNADAWKTVATSDSSWADSSWADSSWADSSWADSSWADSSWADSSWADSSWADESSADASREDAAVGN
jgi:serine protease AprX